MKKDERNTSKKQQMSDAFVTSAFLALSGGFQDAYTYNVRDGVFSNAQTGNVVLMSQHFMKGSWGEALRYLLPILTFVCGVAAAEAISNRYHESRLHWRQRVLLIEMATLAAVGIMPASMNILATGLVSFSCAMQVQAFRKVHGYPYASTMCIGNLREGTASLCAFLRDKDPEQGRRSANYFGIILFFAVGAGIGGNVSLRYGIPTIWICVIFLFVSFCLMSLRRARLY